MKKSHYKNISSHRTRSALANIFSLSSGTCCSSNFILRFTTSITNYHTLQLFRTCVCQSPEPARLPRIRGSPVQTRASCFNMSVSLILPGYGYHPAWVSRIFMDGIPLLLYVKCFMMKNSCRTRRWGGIRSSSNSWLPPYYFRVVRSYLMKDTTIL